MPSWDDEEISAEEPKVKVARELFTTVMKTMPSVGAARVLIIALRIVFGEGAERWSEDERAAAAEIVKNWRL